MDQFRKGPGSRGRLATTARGILLATAAGMRIGFFLEDDNVTGTAAYFSLDGLKLFDAAVAYGLGATTALFAPETGTVHAGKEGVGVLGRLRREA